MIGEKYPECDSLCNGGLTLMTTLKLLLLLLAAPDAEAFVLVLFTED